MSPTGAGRWGLGDNRSLQAGTLQFKALQDSIEGGSELYQLPGQQVSFTFPAHEELLAALIEAIYESHPYEQPPILVQPLCSTRFKYAAGGHNPNKCWHRERT